MAKASCTGSSLLADTQSSKLLHVQNHYGTT